MVEAVKLLISNQYGALVMALIPCFYGVLMSNPIWQHIFLLLAWLCLYLMAYPFLNLFKGRNMSINIKWSIIYGTLSILFALPALWYNWHIFYFAIAMLPFLAVNIYYVKKKNERALLNDLAGIIIFAIAGMASYYFSLPSFDEKIWFVALYPTLFFIGTTLYVKSVLRERKNPIYLWGSYIYHIICIVVFLVYQEYWLALCYFPALIRAIYLPRLKLSVKSIGLFELAITLIFFIMLLFTIY